MPRPRSVLVLVLAALAVLAPFCAPGTESVSGEALPPVPVAAAPEASAAELLAASHRLEYLDTAQGFDLALRAIRTARQKHDTKSELAALLQSAKTARFQNDYPKALSLAAEGLELAARLKNESMVGEFRLLVGFIKWNQADLPTAFKNFTVAERISLTEKNVPLQIAVESARGLLDERNDNPEAALPHLEAARTLAEQTNDAQLPAVLNNLGSYYLNLKDYLRASEYFERALPLSRGMGNQRLIAFLLVNLGQVAVETGHEDAARQHLAEALEISERYKIRRGMADAYYLQAALERRCGNDDRSRMLLGQSLTLAREINNPDLFALIYTEYVATEEASGHYKEALGYARNLAEQKEIIRGEKSRRQFAQLTAEYDAETRAQQIKLLRRDRELDQVDLALKDTELSRAHTRYSALALALILSGLAASAFAGRQRTRARYARLALAETRAAKEQVEEADANKAKLLTIAAQNLQESEARFRNAFELSPLGMALVGINGKWLRVNPALCRIMGYTEAELLAIDFQTLTHPEDLPEDMDFVARLLKGEIESYQMEKRYFHKAGHIVWVRLDVSLIRDSGTHEPRNFISQVQDVTAKRLDEEQLHHAKEEAERANEAKNGFLSRMSHELRTPLNAILGFGQLLEIQDLGLQSNQSVGQILTASRHLLELINEVLDISTIESGMFALSLEPTPVHDVARVVQELVHPLADLAKVRLLPMQPEENCCILADPRRLKQVLLNLISNAIKYNRPGGEVCLSYYVQDSRVGIEVRDTGEGIDAADLEKIFVPFSRLPAALPVPGTGLGLSLSKSLTEAMNGTITVTSHVGSGSVFRVEFARMVEETPWEPPMLDFASVAETLFEPEWRAGATVLYIEDSTTNFELVQRLLCREQGLVLYSARDGKTGLEMANKYLPDIILLDIHLPDMAGSEVLQYLRADPIQAQVPVVAISADVSVEQREKMTKLGVSEYLDKPFEIMDLRRAINDALHASHVR